nr:Sulphatase-modifying factor protein [Opitutaceae bacterium]
MLSHRTRYKLEEWWNTSRPWILGVLGVAALVGLWMLLAYSGPGRAVEPVPEKPAQLDDPEFQRRIAKVQDLEARYRVFAAAEIVSDEALAVLTEAVDLQRAIARSAQYGDYQQQRELERLESELDAVRAKRAVGRIEQLMIDGEADVKGMQLADAEAAYREALQLQRAINTGTAPSRFKNYVREAEIEKALTALQVFPLHFEKEAALEKARAAMDEQRWADALAAYTVARDALDKINRDFATTRFADLAGYDRVAAEIDSLNAAGIARELDAFEKEGDSADRAGDFPAAVIAYAEALIRQQQINQLFSRSRFMSSARIEVLQTKLQTARSQPLAAELAKLDERISEDLRRRRVVAAEQTVPKALELTDRLATEFPRSRFVDGALRIKLSYIGLKRNELKTLQDETFNRLLPMVGVTDRLLFASEVPQGLYQAIMNTNPSRSPGRSMPVDSVNWNDAEEFC